MNKSITYGLTCLTCIVNILFGSAALAQTDWPIKPIRLIVAYSTGGVGDQLARLIGNQLGKDLNIPVVVENRAGASGMIGANACKTAEPDGHSYCIFLMDVVTVNPIIFDNISYDVNQDFIPVSLLADINTILVVPTKTGIHNIQELVQKAKAQPQTTNFESWGVGSTAHLTHRLLEQAFQQEIAHIPYKNTSDLINAVRTGEVDGTISGVSLVAGHISEGTVRAIATVGKDRLSFMPDVPTFSEQGVPLNATLWYGVFAPAATPLPAVIRMNAAISQAVQTTIADGRFDPQWFTARTLTQPEFTDFLKEEEKVWGTIARQSGITLN